MGTRRCLPELRRRSGDRRSISGFDLTLDLQPTIPIDDAVIREWVELSPQERIERALKERSVD